MKLTATQRWDLSNRLAAAAVAMTEAVARSRADDPAWVEGYESGLEDAVTWLRTPRE